MNVATSLTSRKTPVAAVWFMVCAILVVVLALLSRFNGFSIYDDAYPFVRYADHLIAGEGLVWNLGEGKVYGVSSLAYVFVLVPFRLLFPDNMAATLFCASFFWGMVFLTLMFVMVMKTLKASEGFRPYLVGLLLLCLVTSASALRAHFANGMETTFVMSYLAACLLLWEGLRQGTVRPWVVGLVGGLAWWFRPDLLIFTWGVPLLMWPLVEKGLQRRNWRLVLGITVLLSVFSMTAVVKFAGAPLPSGAGEFDAELYGDLAMPNYLKIAWAEFMRFGARNVLLFILLGVMFYFKRKRWASAYNPLQWAVFLVVLGAVLYNNFVVHQVMAFNQRYFYPLFPLLLYLGAMEVIQLPESIRLGSQLSFKRVPMEVARVGKLLVAGILVFYAIDYGVGLRESLPNERFAVFSALKTYQQKLSGHWPRLDRVAMLPLDVKVASAEVGMLAALMPGHSIDDLTIHSTRLVDQEWNFNRIRWPFPSDLIYLPPPRFQKLKDDFLSDGFRSVYTIIPADSLHADMGVAILKESPHYAILMGIFGR